MFMTYNRNNLLQMIKDNILYIKNGSIMIDLYPTKNCDEDEIVSVSSFSKGRWKYLQFSSLKMAFPIITRNDRLNDFVFEEILRRNISDKFSDKISIGINVDDLYKEKSCLVSVNPKEYIYLAINTFDDEKIIVSVHQSGNIIEQAQVSKCDIGSYVLNIFDKYVKE